MAVIIKRLTPMPTEKLSFAAQNAVIFGLGLGNLVALTVAVTTVAFLTESFRWTMAACVLMLVLSVPLSIYLIRSGELASEMHSPVEVIGGFIAFVVGGFIMPFSVIPATLWFTWKAIRQAHQEANPWGKRKPTGKEAFYSVPGSLARFAERGMSTSFFAEHKG